MKPQYAIFACILIMGMQQLLQHFVESSPTSLTIQFIALAISFILIFRGFKDMSVRIKDDQLMTILFVLGFWISAFSTGISVIAEVNFFNADLFKPVDFNLPIYGSIIGQLLMIGGFALNGVGKEYA